ncbi:MAG: hypothetical protein SGARI_000351 [Bacillariaceae sp.]
MAPSLIILVLSPLLSHLLFPQSDGTQNNGTEMVRAAAKDLVFKEESVLQYSQSAFFQWTQTYKAEHGVVPSVEMQIIMQKELSDQRKQHELAATRTQQNSLMNMTFQAQNANLGKFLDGGVENNLQASHATPAPIQDASRFEYLHTVPKNKDVEDKDAEEDSTVRRLNLVDEPGKADMNDDTKAAAVAKEDSGRKPAAVANGKSKDDSDDDDLVGGMPSTVTVHNYYFQNQLVEFLEHAKESGVSLYCTLKKSENDDGITRYDGKLLSVGCCIDKNPQDGSKVMEAVEFACTSAGAVVKFKGKYHDMYVIVAVPTPFLGEKVSLVNIFAQVEAQEPNGFDEDRCRNLGGILVTLLRSPHNYKFPPMLTMGLEGIQELIRSSARFDGARSTIFNLRNCVASTEDDDGCPAFLTLHDKLSEDGDYDPVMENSVFCPQRNVSRCKDLFGIGSCLNLNLLGKGEAKLLICLQAEDASASRSLYSEVAVALSQEPGAKRLVIGGDTSEGVGFCPLKTRAAGKILQSSATMSLVFTHFLLDTAMQQELAKYPNPLVFDRCDLVKQGISFLQSCRSNKLSVAFKETAPPLDVLARALDRHVCKKLHLKDIRFDQHEAEQFSALVEAATASGLPNIWNPEKADDLKEGLILEDIKLEYC